MCGGSNPSGRAKMYAVVRSSLANGPKACQLIHALREFLDKYPQVEDHWYCTSNTIVLLETEDLETLEKRARDKCVTCVRFVEPDWHPDGVLTALALGPDAKKLVRGMKVAFT